jgi:hypothetical protein
MIRQLQKDNGGEASSTFRQRNGEAVQGTIREQTAPRLNHIGYQMERYQRWGEGGTKTQI